MTGATKFPILDPAFLSKMIEVCKDDEQRGLVYILYFTGMHGSCLCKLEPKNLSKEAGKTYLTWSRPKTGKTMRKLIPKEKVEQITPFIEGKKKTLQHYNIVLKQIGAKAGFEGISTMTFRHTRCIRALTEEGFSPWEVTHVMGCTLDVVERNYTKLREDQLERDK